MGALTPYLVLYNTACLAGWGWALLLGCASLAETGGDLTRVWAAASGPLVPVQWAMVLEIVHAVTGAVRSPAFTVFIQVMSRILVLVVALVAPEAQQSWACGMMVLSWGLVEVVRYSFYLNALLTPKGTEGTMYPIFWLRYTLFAILYPTGITGECVTMWSALGTAGLAGALPAGIAPLLVKLNLALYVPLSPFMYMNMVKNRKSAFKKRYPPPEKPKPPERGTQFPADGKGGRSTSTAGRTVIAKALEGAGGERGAKASARAAKEKNWRFGYNKHYMALVRLGCESPEAALGVARAGLDWMYTNMEFIAPDGSKGPFGKMVGAAKGSFETGCVKGTKPAANLSYRVPYNGGWHPSSPKPPPADAVLTDAALKKQATTWAERGVIEPDAAQALCWTSDYFASGKSLQGVYFVMIGAGSAMGPFPKLLELGATVVAIDIPGCWGKGGPRPTKGLWKRLCDTARNSPGELIFPLSKKQSECATEDDLYEASGCDLMNQPGEIANWLVAWQKTIPASASVVIGNYTYLDGDLHVKLALCADHCIAKLCEARSSTAVAFLCTPTDIHVCTDAAHQAAQGAYGMGFGSLGLEKLVNVLTGGTKLVKNALPPVQAKGKTIHLVDGLSVAQGPNYALAKRMQHWRACLAFEAGHTVSSMVAPSTATISVIHNRTFAWAYGGMPYFGYEVFKQETTNAVMAALLMHDVLNAASPKNPKNRKQFGIDNTLELFGTQSVHGGLWRCAYKVDSIGEVSALIYFAGLCQPVLGGITSLALLVLGVRQFL